MITDYFHVELNGVKYRLAEDAEGEHYIDHGDPLRNQTFAIVEGAQNSRFQMRPDIKVWAWDDWSGGEGQYIYDPQNPNRYWYGDIINPFRRPGTLEVGPGTEKTTETDATSFDYDIYFARSGEKLWGVEIRSGGTNLREWDSASGGWSTTAKSRASSPGADAATADSSYVYIKEFGVDDIYRFDPVGWTFTLWNNDTSATKQQVALATIGKYIYLYDPALVKVWEIPKTGTPPVDSTVLYDLSDEGGRVLDEGKGQMADAHNRLYITQIVEEDTVVHEITPSTAAATGFGREIARLEGFICEAITFHLGFIYLIGKNTSSSTQTNLERQVLYLQPSGEYGTLGIIRPDDTHASIPTVGEANTMLNTYFTLRTGSSNLPHLFTVDAVSGGMACVSRFDYGAGDTVLSEGIGEFRGEIFWSTDDDATNQEVHRTVNGEYYLPANGECFVVSPIWDFGLIEPKILQSIRLITEPNPSAWVVEVDYQVDQDGTWTEAVSQSASNSTTETGVVSTDTSTVEFSNLQLRIRMWHNGGPNNPTTTPVVLGVEVRSTVVQPIRSWDILVDLTDEDGQAQNRSWNGATLRNNIITAVQSNAIVDFKDGYGNRNPGQYNQHDVYIDSWDIVLTSPGEGFARLRLVEVS